MSSLQTFHLFTKLPYDIRRLIYTLHTPSRVVCVEEGPINVEDKYDWSHDDYDNYFDWAYEIFYKEMQETGPTFKTKLHPELAAFAHNWRHQIPWSSHDRPLKQTSLDSFGFSSNKPLYNPWVPTEDTPRIPTDWFVDYPQLAFELTRESALYGKAEVPVFLHVCVESREALTAWGYRLLFSTRTCGPRTWFHPGRDRLYIPYQTTEFPPLASHGEEIVTTYPIIKPGLLLSGCHWDIGQYSVQDLKQVESVILGRPTINRDRNELAQDLQSIIPLLSNLDKIFLENWSLEDFCSWFEEITGASIYSDEIPASSVACIPVEDIDVLGHTFWQRSVEYDSLVKLPYTGYNNTLFNHLKIGPDLTSYHLNHATAVQLRLMSWFTGFSLSTGISIKLPEICHVHLFPDSYSESFMTSRLKLWKAMEALDNDEIRQPDFMKKFSELISCCPSPFKIRWQTDAWTDWPVLVEDMLQTDAANIERASPGSLQAWYLNRFKMHKPQCIEI